ncbi:DUF4249 domain-containing protein [Mucilaginibacter sp. OK283]|uniref:DUF4249 domain-containing protein n=1 Tax=Mucilaginibacter sp. OK283 TaxID=1881049 RepID=UPI002100E64F|nr:DUF4249 domain-containing protein [Mucilaginibacter sp. OK283]
MSCTKVIDLKLGDDTGKLVIEGNITDMSGVQYVKLSRNVTFTTTNTYPPVSGAVVSVSDGNGTNYMFTEGPSGTYSIASMKGITGNTYTMTVLTGGKTYTASSTMSGLIQLDSITAKTRELDNSKNQKEITVHYQDPAGTTNQYRFVMYVNNIQVKQVFAFNDDFTDGRYVHNNLREDDIDIYPGDTVTVEMQCIDKPVYTYWYTLMQQGGSNGPGGAVAPANPPSNISPTALGYFSAHTTQSKSIIVK